MAPNDGTVKAGDPGAIFQQDHADEEVSSFVLACLKQLNDCYPQPVDIASLMQGSGADPVGARVLGLFRDSGFLSGTEARTVLSLRGQRSIRDASTAEPDVASFFRGTATDDPNGVLLALWRGHFRAWDRYTFGGL